MHIPGTRRSGRSGRPSSVTLLAVGALVLPVAAVVSGVAIGSSTPASADVGPLPTVSVVSTTAAMTNVTSHTGVTRTATCAAGQVLVGGGGYLRRVADPATVPTNGLVLGGAAPSTGDSPVDRPFLGPAQDPKSWLAVANFTGVAETGDQATAYALCATGGPTHTVVATATTTGANALQQVAAPTVTTATCPAATTLIGGGAVTQTPDQVNDGTTVGNNGNLKPLATYPSDAAGAPAADGATTATSWSAYGSAGVTSTTDTVTAVALCTPDALSQVQVARTDASGPDAQTGTTVTSATAVCPAGTRLLGGGYRVDQTVNGTAGLQPQQGYHLRGSYPSTGAAAIPVDVTSGTDPAAWSALLQAGGQNLPAGSSMQTHTFAMCAQPAALPTTTPSPSSTPTPAPTPPVASTPTTTTLGVTSSQARAVDLVATVTPGAAGAVTFYDGATPVATAATAAGGRALVSLAQVAPGSHSYRATFTPSDPRAFVGSSSAVGTVAVRTSSKARETFPSSVRPGARAVGVVTVKLAGVTAKASGRVKVTLRGEVVGRGRLARGKVRLVLEALPRGRQVLKVAWAGDPLGVATVKRFTITQR